MKISVFNLFAIGSLVRSTRTFSPGRRSFKTQSTALANSPIDNIFAFLKDGKKGLVKSLAGDYDAVAVQGKIVNLVKENPVLMLSFTT